VVPARAHEAGEQPADRAKRSDPGIYEPEPGETIRVDRITGRCKFLRFGHDNGGDFAVVLGGKSGHILERCVFVDRVHPVGKKARDWAKWLRSNLSATA
jgi:hypothetical protein